MSALTVIEHQAVEAAAPLEVLTSRLGEEEYGINILAVQEIRRYEQPTRIANAASHMLGIMNLRGVIVPIVDLRRLLGLPAENGVNTVTVVVNFGGRTVGLVVDGVSDVIQPRPPLGAADAGFIVGLATLDTTPPRMLLIVDLGVLLQDF